MLFLQEILMDLFLDAVTGLSMIEFDLYFQLNDILKAREIT